MASDSFTRANETPLASPWATDASFAKGVNLLSNAAGNSSVGDALSYRTDSTVLFSQITISAAGGFDGGPAICCDGAGSCYLINNSGGGNIVLYKLVGTGFYGIGTVAGTYTAGHTYSVERAGGNVVVRDNGTAIITQADATFTTGAPGMHAYDATIRFDDWTDGVSGATPAITDFDTDETVSDGQTSVAVTGTDFGTTNADRTFALVQGATAINQTETGTGTSTAATVTINANPGGAGAAGIKYGSANLRCTLTAGGANGSLAVTVAAPSGVLYVDIGTPDPEAQNRISSLPVDIASGDQVQARGVGGGSYPTGLTLYSDGTYGFSSGNTPTAFEVRILDNTDSTYSAWVTQFVSTPLSGKGATHGLNAWMKH